MTVVPITEVHIASPTIPDQVVPSLTIVGDKTIPEGPTRALSVEATRDTFVRDGKAIAEALWGSLPGGTIDVLIGEMLQRRASLFRVRFATPAEVGQ